MLNQFTNLNKISISINNSSLITDIEWDRYNTIFSANHNSIPNGNLVLTFLTGERYEYVGVPASVLQDMLSSNSVGTYFHSKIKDNYVTYKLEY
jgi:hypothetical protein